LEGLHKHWSVDGLGIFISMKRLERYHWSNIVRKTKFCGNAGVKPHLFKILQPTSWNDKRDTAL